MELTDILDDLKYRVLSNSSKFILIKGSYDYGKSTLLKQIYSSIKYKPKIFQAGVNPKNRVVVAKRLIAISKHINENNIIPITLIIDEIDDSDSLGILFENQSLFNKMILCTNSQIPLKYSEKFYEINLDNEFQRSHDFVCGDRSPGEILRSNCGNTNLKSKEELTSDKQSVTHSITVIETSNYTDTSVIDFC
ncbi:hypothetical protein ACR6HW_11855 [Fusibacter sp. JL298sf-3]